jgi:hypothetical protein
MTGIVYSLDMQKPERKFAVDWSQVPHQRIFFRAQICVIVTGSAFDLRQDDASAGVKALMGETNVQTLHEGDQIPIQKY